MVGGCQGSEARRWGAAIMGNAVAPAAMAVATPTAVCGGHLSAVLSSLPPPRHLPSSAGGYANGFKQLCQDESNCLKVASWYVGDLANQSCDASVCGSFASVGNCGSAERTEPIPTTLYKVRGGQSHKPCACIAGIAGTAAAAAVAQHALLSAGPPAMLSCMPPLLVICPPLALRPLPPTLPPLLLSLPVPIERPVCRSLGDCQCGAALP
jgi:hypothetical protein